MISEMTASILISSGSVSSRGASPTARFVMEQVEEGRNQLQKSYTLGLRGKGVFDELFRVAEERHEPNWDGYGAEPVNDDTYRLAYRFLEALPLGIAAPAVGAEPDGHITLEWYQTPRRTLSVSVSPEGELHYAALLPGPRKAYGTEQFVGDVPVSILELIRDVTAG